jgi:hypothetical protein
LVTKGWKAKSIDTLVAIAPLIGTGKGKDQMLQEFWEFDRKLIKEEYQKIVDDIKN